MSDAWAARALLGRETTYHPLDLPPTGQRSSGIAVDHEALPTLPEVVALREERVAMVRHVLGGLTDDDLADGTVQVRGPGYPRAGRYPVRRCVQTLVAEEWQHRQYAERDLNALAERPRPGVPADGRETGA